MAEAVFQHEAEGRFRVQGELTFETVSLLVRDSASMFQTPFDLLDVDLSGVSRSDSAGLALLIEWSRGASRNGKKIRFHKVPRQMRVIAEASDLDRVLSLEEP